MKRFLIVLSCSAIMLWSVELAGIRTVYLLPMSRGLDQYLANRLTNKHVFTVVTDAKMADAVFTDRIGAGFAEQLKDLTSSKPVPEKAATREAKNDAAKTDNPEPKPESPAPPEVSSTVEALGQLTAPPSTLSRARGTVFLVDAKSGHVIWSAYDLPKDSSSEHLDRTASDIVSRLMRELKKK